MAAVYPLNIDQGETFRLALGYGHLPAEGVTSQSEYVPIDLTGATGRMQIRAKYGAPVLAEANSQNGGVVIDGANGIIYLALTDVQTDVIGVREGSIRPRTTAVYDLEITFADGDVKRVVEGSIAINPNITRLS